MDAAIHLKPVDRVPNAPFYEAPICTYFASSFKDALLESQSMAETHLAALETFRFDWIMVGYIFSTSGTTSLIIPRENFNAMNREVLDFE
jgi:hypothetical protein